MLPREPDPDGGRQFPARLRRNRRRRGGGGGGGEVGADAEGLADEEAGLLGGRGGECLGSGAGGRPLDLHGRHVKTLEREALEL